MTFPWEKLPVPIAEPQLPALQDTVTALQRDFAFAIAYTAVHVHSTHDELAITVNTRRGQIVPRGECKFTDGSTIEFQDLGMPQPGAETMTVAELLARTWETALLFGLELV